MINFWLPRYRYEYVEWLSNRYPNKKIMLKRMVKKQLVAIYINVRQSLNGGTCATQRGVSYVRKRRYSNVTEPTLPLNKRRLDG